MRAATALLLLAAAYGCVSGQTSRVDHQATRDPVLTDPENNPWIYPGLRRTVGIDTKLAEEAYREGWEIGLRHGNEAVGTRPVAPFLLSRSERHAWEKAFEQGIFAGAAFRKGHDGRWITEQLDGQGR